MTGLSIEIPEVYTNRLILRAPINDDLEALTAFYVSKRSSMAGGDLPLGKAVTAALAMFGHWAYRGYGLFAITARGNDTPVGFAGPYFPPQRPETEIGWVLFDGCEGKGYATEAAQAMVRFARETLGWSEIVHYIDAANAPSIKLAERIGAYIDTDATQPNPDKPCLVYRQPRPEAV